MALEAIKVGEADKRGRKVCLTFPLVPVGCSRSEPIVDQGLESALIRRFTI